MPSEVDPNLIVYFRGRYVPLAEANVGILTHALHYGTGVFEGIRAHWDEAQSELFVLRPLEHYQRWKRNAAILHIDIPASAEELCDDHAGADAPQPFPRQRLRPPACLQMRGARRRQPR